ncbi:MAG: hypothetical protein J0665_14225 [Deltaproteobacteria bacterium]|nr:hypothetical protein [Deltaproteobacteria bacterium]
MKRTCKKMIMTGYCIVYMLACTLVTSAVAVEKPVVFNDKNETAAYNPKASYTGEFIQSRIYYHNPRSAVWRRMNHSDNYLDVVTCQAALISLGKYGNWQGHLKQDGSCGPLDEPSFFALGNRINYDISLDLDISSN